MVIVAEPSTILSLDIVKGDSATQPIVQPFVQLYSVYVNWIPRKQAEETIWEQANSDPRRKVSCSFKWKVRARAQLQAPKRGSISHLSADESLTSGSFAQHLRRPSQAFRSLLPKPPNRSATVNSFCKPPVHWQPFYSASLAPVPSSRISMVLRSADLRAAFATVPSDLQPLPIGAATLVCNATPAVVTSLQPISTNPNLWSSSRGRKRGRSRDPRSKSSHDEAQQGSQFDLLRSVSPTSFEQHRAQSFPVNVPLQCLPMVFPTVENYHDSRPVPWLVPPVMETKKRRQHKGTKTSGKRVSALGLEPQLLEEGVNWQEISNKAAAINDA